MKSTAARVALKITTLLSLIATTVLYNLKNSCGSACDQHSFLNPLGIAENSMMACTLQCVERPNDFFYLAFDISILLVIATIVFDLLYFYNKKRKAHDIK